MTYAKSWFDDMHPIIKVPTQKLFSIFEQRLLNESGAIIDKTFKLTSKAYQELTNCSEPFSLLGVVETYDRSKLTKYPFLIIPNANTNKIKEWQNKNTLLLTKSLLHGEYWKQVPTKLSF